MSSFIVLYMVDPRYHVIYGYEGNPYDSDLSEEILKTAVDFVEDMGAILEEIPWQGMSPEDRRNWIEKETLYPQMETDDIEEIADLEEIQPGELLEVIEGEGEGDEESELRTEADEDVTEAGGVQGEAPAGVREEHRADEEGDFNNLFHSHT